MHADRERGEIGLKLIVAMALVAGLAWTVPMVFLGRESTEHAAVVTGAAENEPPPSEGAEVAAAGPIDLANDAAAQASLNSAIRAAQMYFAETGGYAGFGVQTAAHYDPTLRLTSGPAAPGVVSVRGVTPTTVVLVSVTDSGGFLCAAAASEVLSFGRADASSPAQCAGGWG
jgi:hypothetical protein